MLRLCAAVALVMATTAANAQSAARQTYADDVWRDSRYLAQNDVRGAKELYGAQGAVRLARIERRLVGPPRRLRSAAIAPAVLPPSPVREIGRALEAPIRFIRGKLSCALNVNSALAERGIRGTGSAMARSFLSWGRPSAPVPGAVAYTRCCGPTGHVAVVDHLDRHGRPVVWNPSRRGWRLMVLRRPALFRAAS